MAVTAFPVILVNSATGTDSGASGAGPGTALTGIVALTDSGGTVVTLDPGTNLTGVATDGSHVIYLIDSTAGDRNFAAINNKSGSGGATPTVTVEQAFTGSLIGKSWAIGGVRASIWSTASRKLFDNNGGNGDAMPGWTVQMQSSHTESISNPINFWRSGDSTSGPIILTGTGTPSVITFTNNDNGFIIRGTRWRFIQFEIQNNNGTKNSSTGFACTAGQQWFEQIKIADATNSVWKGLDLRGDKNIVRTCEIGYCSSHGITFENGTVSESSIIGNSIHNCGGTGVKANGGDMLGNLIAWNVISTCTEDGIYWIDAASGTNRGGWIIGNTIDSCTSDGIEIASTTANLSLAAVLSNICSNNGGFGVNFSGGGMTVAIINSVPCIVSNNDTYNNTSGAYQPTGAGSNDPALNPSFVGGGNFTPQNTNLSGDEFPMIVGPTTSYGYPGSLQPQGGTGGGSSTVVLVQNTFMG